MASDQRLSVSWLAGAGFVMLAAVVALTAKHAGYWPRPAHLTERLSFARADVFALSGNGKSPLDIATVNSKHKTSPVLELLQLEVSAAVLEIAMTWYRQRRSREA